MICGKGPLIIPGRRYRLPGGVIFSPLRSEGIRRVTNRSNYIYFFKHPSSTLCEWRELSQKHPYIAVRSRFLGPYVHTAPYTWHDAVNWQLIAVRTYAGHFFCLYPAAAIYRTHWLCQLQVVFFFLPGMHVYVSKGRELPRHNSVFFMFRRDVSYHGITQVWYFQQASDFPYILLIRAKRVSNCYMQEKKNWPFVCLSGCSDNLLVLVWKNCLGFSVGYQRAPGWF